MIRRSFSHNRFVMQPAVQTRFRFVSLLSLLGGYSILFFAILEPPFEKTAVLVSVAGILLILFGTHFLGGRGPLKFSNSLFNYLPIAIGTAGLLLAAYTQAIITAFVFAVALTLLFLATRMISFYRPAFVLWAVFLKASLG